MPTKTASSTRRTTVKKVAAPAKKTSTTPDAIIDYPQEGELIVPGHYAVRISAKPDFDVEISTDGRIWEGTRASVGFHWFDWNASKAGRAVLSLRVKSGKGRWKNVSERECVVLERHGN